MSVDSQPHEPLAVGVDGCRGGWIAAALYLKPMVRTELRLFSTFAQLVRWHGTLRSCPIIGADIPIGAPERLGFRPCDNAARLRLGARRTSVFHVPDRELHRLTSFKDVQDIVARRRCSEPTSLGMSRQSFGIMAKILEVDLHLQSIESHERWLVEVHPEVSFLALTKRVLAGKKSQEGRRHRREALRGVFADIDRQIAALRRTVARKRVEDDDIFDAYAALWSATRYRAKVNETLGDGALDALNFPMRIVV
jgi:predicted RNase H-like nuclease